MAFMVKDKNEILQEALQKIHTTTGITASSPGSVARAITEAFATELGNMYSVLDLNMSLSVLSSAQGRTLDLLGSLYNIQRKTLTDLAAIDKSLGSFYFYLDSPHTSSITVPIGTKILTNSLNVVGEQFTYATTEEFVIPAGRTRAYATIRPLFGDAIFTAGPNTLTVIDPAFTQPAGATLKATNPKAIDAQLGYEDDDSYRNRIIKGVRTSVGGTLEALRLVGLNIRGVRDITMRNSPYGLGSFEAIVVVEDNLINSPVMRRTAEALETVRPVGVRMYIRQPDLLPLTVYGSIVIRENVNVDRTNIARRTEVGILRYLNSLLVGTPLIYNQLIQAILDATDVVTDVTITSLAVNGTEILRKNYTPEDDQQIIPGDVQITLAT